MSSILRGARTKRRGHPSLSDGGKQIKPWLRPHGGTVTNAINTARTGSVQGMVMVQRRPTVKQTPVAKESTAQIVTPYAQSHGSSVAMEEVLRDLEILQQQQQESIEQLERSREMKAHKEAKRLHLEHKLGDLKFQDGQLKKVLESVVELLNVSRGQLESSTNDTDRADRELKEFSESLSSVRKTKEVVVGYQRRQARFLSRFTDKMEKLQHVQKAAAVRLQKEKESEKSILEEELRLRLELKEQCDHMESLESQATDRQDKKATMEHELSNLSEELTKARQNHNQALCEIEHHEVKYVEAIRLFDEKEKPLLETSRDLVAEIKHASTLRAQTEKLVQEATNRHRSIKKFHDLTEGPSNVLPTLDMLHFNELLCREEEARGEEESNSFAQIAKSLKHRSELLASFDKITVQEQEKLRLFGCVRNKEEALLSLLENEDRCNQEQETISTVLKQLREDRKTRGADKEKTKCEAEKHSKCIRQQIVSLKKQIKVVQKSLEEKNEALKAIEAARGISTLEADSKTSKTKESIQKLSHLLKALSKKLVGVGDAPCSANADVQKKIEAIKYENPLLDSVDVIYKPELTPKQQAKHELALVIEDLKKRVSSAKKMRKDLEDADRREAEAKCAMEQKAEQERRQREETRRRREERLQSQEASMRRSAERKLKQQNEEPFRDKNHSSSHRLASSGQRAKRSNYGESKISNRPQNKNNFSIDEDTADQHNRSNSPGSATSKEKGGYAWPNITESNSRKSEQVNRRCDESEPSKQKKSNSQKRDVFVKRNEAPIVEKPTLHVVSCAQSDNSKKTTMEKTKTPTEAHRHQAKEEQIQRSSVLATEVPKLTDEEGTGETAGFSETKPRNLFVSFAHISKTVGASKSVVSSQKKVHWRVDERQESSKSRGTHEEETGNKKAKKTFSSCAIVKSNSVRSKDASNLSNSKSTSVDVTSEKSKSCTRQSSGESRGRRNSVSNTYLTRSDEVLDSLALIGKHEKQAFHSQSMSRRGDGMASKYFDGSKDEHRSRPKPSMKSERRRGSTGGSHKRIKPAAPPSTDQRPAKRRRNGVNKTIVAKKSFGEDVEFNF